MSAFAATDDAAAEWLRRHAFPRQPSAEPLVGAEIEFLVRDSTGRAALVDDALGDWLTSLLLEPGWLVLSEPGDPPIYQVPAGGTISLEPGGQLEYSSPPFASPSELILHLQDVAAFLAAHAARESLSLESFGIDPDHALHEVPLQLHGSRYDSMDRYFARTGDAGQRMMRQTAALQISIDPAHDPALTWSVVNRAAPVLTALFANSSRYAGADTGHASHRAYTWRQIDPLRTGVAGGRLDGLAGGTDAPEAYARFALDAPSIFDAPLYRPFRDLPDPSEEKWRIHLTTLFPEVRPKRYYEVRCIDAISPDSYAAPIILVWALCSDASALHAAAELLSAVTDDALQRAAVRGLDDEELHMLAGELVGLALNACGRAGEDLAQRAHADALENWWTQSRRDVRRSSTTSSLTIM